MEDGLLKVLLGKERWGRHRGSWGLLGGKIQNDCVHETLKNELKEESCGLLDIDSFKQRFIFDVSGKQSPEKMYRITFATPIDPIVEFVGDFAERIWLFENGEEEHLKSIAPECFTAGGVLIKDYFEKTDMRWFELRVLIDAINSNWACTLFRRDLLFMLHELKKTLWPKTCLTEVLLDRF
jgi:8-oxo-dGTP pyrophosphatase MutT (NUDIX family)